VTDHPTPSLTVLPVGWSPSTHQLEVLADFLIRLARRKSDTAAVTPDRVPTRKRRHLTPRKRP
jgi:hypothetical protein